MRLFQAGFLIQGIFSTRLFYICRKSTCNLNRLHNVKVKGLCAKGKLYMFNEKLHLIRYQRHLSNPNSLNLCFPRKEASQRESHYFCVFLEHLPALQLLQHFHMWNTPRCSNYSANTNDQGSSYCQNAYTNHLRAAQRA